MRQGWRRRKSGTRIHAYDVVGGRGLYQISNRVWGGEERMRTSWQARGGWPSKRGRRIINREDASKRRRDVEDA
eukprot:1335028-Pyramimonas_sp.AAC.1